MLVLEIAHDLAQAEHAHGERDELDAVGQFDDVEGEARRAGIDVLPGEPEQDAEHHHGQRLHHRAGGQRHRGDEAQHHQREIFRCAELQGEIGERRREHREQEGRDRAGEEGAERRGGERRPRPALPRHLVAVDGGDHR